MPMERDFKYFSLERLLNHDVLKVLKLCLADTVLNIKVGCLESFEDWVHELDQKFAVSKRKIALIIDNCTAHPDVENLKWVELIFLPPNTTSDTQQMDHGIIRDLKAKYRSLAVRKLILALEKEEPIPKFSIFLAMYMLKKAWDAISNQTFTNCFRKSGISEKDVEKATNDEEDPFKGLEDDNVKEDSFQTLGADLSILKERFADQIEVDISLDEYVHFDIEVNTSHGKLTNAEIIADVTRTQEDNSDDEESDNVEGEPIIKPEIEEVQKAIGILEDFSLYSKFGEAMMWSLKELNFNVEKEYVFNKKQTLISDFFLKQ